MLAPPAPAPGKSGVAGHSRRRAGGSGEHSFVEKSRAGLGVMQWGVCQWRAGRQARRRNALEMCLEAGLAGYPAHVWDSRQAADGRKIHGGRLQECGPFWRGGSGGAARPQGARPPRPPLKQGAAGLMERSRRSSRAAAAGFERGRHGVGHQGGWRRGRGTPLKSTAAGRGGREKERGGRRREQSRSRETPGAESSPPSRHPSNHPLIPLSSRTCAMNFLWKSWKSLTKVGIFSSAGAGRGIMEGDGGGESGVRGSGTVQAGKPVGG